MPLTNIVFMAFAVTNGVKTAVEVRLDPVYARRVVETCQACRNGWAPLEAPCTCKTETYFTGMYTFVESKPNNKD